MISFQLRVLEPKSSHLREETPIIILFFIIVFQHLNNKEKIVVLRCNQSSLFRTIRGKIHHGCPKYRVSRFLY